jgi:hypothetical protein
LSRFSDLAHQLRGQLASFAPTDGLQVHHPPLESCFDDGFIGLEQLDPQQAIMVGRLMLGRDPEPEVIGFVVTGHRGFRRNRWGSDNRVDAILTHPPILEYEK